MLQIWFECLEFAFQFLGVEWFEFTFECFKSLSNDSNLDLNASDPFGMVRLPFEWLELAFECFESLLNVSNLQSNASNPFRMVRIWIWML